MHRCKREAVDLEKMQSLEENLEEQEEKLKKKKKSREMEEGPGTPQQVLLALLWIGTGGVAVVKMFQEQVFVTFSDAAQNYKSDLFQFFCQAPDAPNFRSIQHYSNDSCSSCKTL